MQPTHQQVIPASFPDLDVTSSAGTEVTIPAGYDFLLTSLFVKPAYGETGPQGVYIYDFTNELLLWAAFVDEELYTVFSFSDLEVLAVNGGFQLGTDMSDAAFTLTGYLLGPTGASVTVTLE